MKKGKVSMKKIRLGLVMVAAMMVASVSQAALWTNKVDYTFSNENNWTGAVNGVYFTHLEVLTAVKGTTAGNHALVDAGFAAASTNAALGNTGIHPGAAGTAYVDIQSGGTLRAQNLQLGSLTQGTYGGNLTLKTGGTLMGTATNANSGLTSIGFMGAGLLTVEAGAAYLGNANLTLGTNGTMKFIFGANSVSTFNVHKKDAVGSTILNGLIQVDLGTLTTSGTYTLINGISNTLTGTTYDWLTLNGGSVSNNGTWADANFAVLNGEGKKWTLALADNNHDLNLTVIPEPTTISLFVVAGIGAMMLRRMTR
jgi:hypothetical protein